MILTSSCLVIGIRDKFLLGVEVSCPNIFSIDYLKIKWFCPNITCFFARKLPFEIFRGAASPLAHAHTPMCLVVHK